MGIHGVKKQLRALADREKARQLRRFFKTGPGEYAEGDIFLGIRVPDLRKVAKEHASMSLKDTKTLLKSPIHDERLVALIILISQFRKGDQDARKRIYSLYINHTRFINNWDLVDGSAPHIVGAYLLGKGKEPLYVLAKSESLWERRIAILSTFHYIKRGEYSETIKISKMLLGDREDLIHKAVGWMLREVGKRDLKTEEALLKRHYKNMPRTMLRYAIERFPEPRRLEYLRGKV